MARWMRSGMLVGPGTNRWLRPGGVYVKLASLPRLTDEDSSRAPARVVTPLRARSALAATRRNAVFIAIVLLGRRAAGDGPQKRSCDAREEQHGNACAPSHTPFS